MTLIRTLLSSLALLLCTGLAPGTALASQPAAAAEQAPKKVLRYAFKVAETSFDPAYITDLYSRVIAAGIFDAPLQFEFLAQPTRMRPNTLAAMPEVSDDFRVFTFRLKPGIHFADDPAFKGQKRELTAQDYVYSLKRHYDPRWKSGNLYLLEADKILGLSELRRETIDQKKPFDYDREVEGLRALDRYTFQIRLAEPKPRFLYHFADGSFTGAVAREVVELYGDKVGDHPVGTGPFMVKEWKRSSRIVLARNPNYREVFYDEHPPAGDARLQAIAQRFKGKRLPLLDEVHIAIIEESQPRWLSFLNVEHDMIEEVPGDFAEIALPNNQLAPNLAKQGIQMLRYARPDVALSYFGMENPVVGGYEPHKVALRRAMSLGVDVDREIRLVRRSQAVPAQGPLAPQTWGYDPAFKSTMSEYNVAKAKALLDLHGWVDRNGDGWREQPDGQPLVIEYQTQPDQRSRQLIELWQKNMAAIGIKMDFKTAKWPENLKASRGGKLMMWGVGWLAGQPDADTFLALGYGPNKGQSNHARFDLPAFNRLYEQQRVLPDGPERMQAMQDAARLMVAYMPYKVHVHQIFTDLTQPWVLGYHRNIFVRDFWRYIDVDPTLQRGLRTQDR
ncbi:ABC transporter substrate-binding protein [Pseudorhodoferax sp.]|uniref:ABC transporter substrate-binding protein n=1 Tax=Pseudorhodoferax sp. TaxID=1993553 RepID=UPI002DD68433|nr:ABC transporter substrate-binding protein [Pseudorhodoferax sp.]